MTITDDWIGMNATGFGGWTRAQLKLLGVKWPPRKGWRAALIGKEISDETAREFERIGAERRTNLAKQLIENERA